MYPSSTPRVHDAMSLCLARSACRVIVTVVTAVLSGFSLASCQPMGHTLMGTVRDAEDGRTIAVAQVRTADTTVPVDQEGRFELTLDLGTHRVEAVARGYEPRAFTVTIRDATVAYMRDVSLSRSPLCGYVLDDLSGRAVVGAQVRCGDAQATTDTAGLFELPASGRAPLLISSPGYLPRNMSPDKVSYWLESSGTPPEPLPVSLTPRLLAGIVRESGSARPLSGVLVSVGRLTTHTDARGYYQVRYVELVSDVSFSSADYVSQEAAYVGQSHQDALLEPLDVTEGATNRATDQTSSDGELPGQQRRTQTGGTEQVTPAPTPDAHLLASCEGNGSPAAVEGGEQTQAALPQHSQLVGKLRDGIADKLRDGTADKLRDAVAGESVSGALILAYPSGNTSPELLRPDDEGRFVVEDALSLSRLLVKAPGYRRVTLPITQAGAITVSLEPFFARGIYIPFGRLTQPDRIAQLLALVQGSEELNAVVVDVKSDRARIAWPSENPLALEVGAYQRDVMDLREFLRACQEKGIYTIARMVVFKDHLLASKRPEWAVGLEDGTLYTDQEGLHWVDPFRQPVRDYNIALAREVADMGFDEIQFDYVRFPDIRGVRGLVYREENTLESRTAAVTEFCAQAYKSLSATPAFVSLDVFGLNVWLDHPRDNGIGQRIDDVAPHLDYISPMLYPSLFGPGNLGLEEPALHPYEVVYRSVVKTKKRTDTLVRPWLQHYSLGGIIYDTVELLEQKKAAEDAGSCGWLFWNAGGKYRPEVFELDAYRLLDKVASPTDQEGSTE